MSRLHIHHILVSTISLPQYNCCLSMRWFHVTEYCTLSLAVEVTHANVSQDCLRVLRSNNSKLIKSSQVAYAWPACSLTLLLLLLLLHNLSTCRRRLYRDYNNSARRCRTIFATCAKFITDWILGDDKGVQGGGPDVGGLSSGDVDVLSCHKEDVGRATQLVRVALVGSRSVGPLLSDND